MTTLTDLTLISLRKMRAGQSQGMQSLWQVRIHAGPMIVYQEEADSPEAAVFAADLALERFRDDTQPEPEYYEPEVRKGIGRVVSISKRPDMILSDHEEGE